MDDNRTIRVFISSTFRDMQAERDILIKKIFPQLRKMCEERAVTWTEVDLRWGITDEEKSEGKVLPLCLAEIQRCRPYFIGLLGERYGWVPEGIPEDLLEMEPWLAEHLSHSVTELEILHGVLRDPVMADRALFYFRDPRFLDNISAGEKADFLPEDDASRDKLADLKARIRAAHASGSLVYEPRENYPAPEALGEQVLADLSAIIDQLYPKDETPDPLAQEAMRHEAYAHSHRLAFVGRTDQLLQMDEHLATDSWPLVLTGESGCGKSALLAEWAARWRENHPDDLVIQHYIGSTPESADWQGVVRRILGELKRAFAITDELPLQPEALRTALQDWLTKAAGKRRVVLVLDDLNKLSTDDPTSRQIGWLPVVVPPNVRLLVSALPGESLDSLRRRSWPELAMPLFDRSEIIPAATEFYAIFSKKLPQEILTHMEATPAATNPLFLRAVLDELRQFGKHEELGNKAAEYLAASDLPDLFDRILTRWNEDFGQEQDHTDLVHRTLCLIASARIGLSEAELLDLLGTDNQPLPRSFWTPLYLAAENALAQQTGLLTFGHDYLHAAVKNRWLRDETAVHSFRLQLADYFGKIPEPTDRKLDELPWLLHDIELWQPLAQFLSDAQVFLRLRSTDRRKHELHRLWIPLRRQFDVGELNRRMMANIEGADAGSELLLPLLNEVALFHSEAGEYDLAEPLLKRVLAMAEEGRSGPTSVTTALHNLTMVLMSTGRLDEAEAICRRRLQIAQTNYELNDTVFAGSLSGLALLFTQMDRLSVAEVLYRRALTIGEAVYGVDGPLLTTIRSNLAVVLHKMGQFSEAESLIRWVLTTDQSKLGLGDPKVAFQLNILASILKDTNRVQEAEPLLRRALEIEEASFGPDHPDVATYLSNLAILLAKTNRIDEAERLHRRALEIRQRVLAPDHPNYAISLDNLAKILQTKNQLHDAELLYRRALEIEEASLGPIHTGVAATLNNLGELLRLQNCLVEAEPLLRRALAIRIERLGNDHHLVAESRNNLALLLRFTNCQDEAEQLFRQALQGYEATLGPDHPEIAVVLDNLAGLLRSTNRLEKVEGLYRRALKIVEDSFGPDHPKVSTRLNNLALYLKIVGRVDEAESMYRRALEIREKSYGPYHPEVAAVLSNLGILLKDEDRLEEAEGLLKRALAIDERSCVENHPKLAIRLCNMADLHFRANRLEEARLLLQRAIKILLWASANNRNEHPELRPTIDAYARLLLAMGKPSQSIINHINELIRS